MIKIKGLTAEDLNGFMDVGTEFHGELRFRNTFRIDGKVKGRIVSENTLIVGESGEVDAEIECGVVSIRGTVSGRIQGRERIELLSGSKVQAVARLAAPRHRGRRVLPGRVRDDADRGRGGRPRYPDGVPGTRAAGDERR